LESITKDVKNNWALKLGNLRRLKKSMDRYTLNELKLDISKYDKIDLPLIARTSSSVEILKLFEYIVLIIVSCPLKPVFIKRIMELDEEDQMQMMFFIQKVMANEEEPNQQQEIDKKEIDSLRAEKKKLSDKLLNLEQELTLAHEEYAALHSELQHFKVENERLSHDIGRKSVSEVKERKAADLEMMVRIGEKDEVISDLKKLLERNRKKYESDINQVRDELDIANNKLVEAAGHEKLLVQYKKRLESCNSFKAQVDELQKQNEILSAQVSNQRIDIENLIACKKQLETFQEKYEQERVRSETLLFSIENKENSIKKLEKNLKDSSENVIFLRKRLEELETDHRFENSAMSEESFNNEHLPVSRDRLKPSEQSELHTKELLKLTEKLLKKTEKTRILKETLKMTTEDFSVLLIQNSYNMSSQQDFIDEIQNNNLYLSEEIQKLSDSIKAKDSELFIHNQTLEDLEDVKNSKQNLQNSYKSLLNEKEELVKRLSDLTSDLLDLKSGLNLKENLIKDLNFKVKDLEDKITAIQFESGPKSATKQNALAEQRISDLQQRIKELGNENVKIIEDSREQIKNAKEDYENELRKKDEEMIRLTEEATSELMKHREQLVMQLQSERRNSIMNFQRAMSIRESPLACSNNKEVFKLREVLMEKEKEIHRLNKNNRELKKCWKQNAKLLKAVWKELEKETGKIQDAVKDSIIF
jgi:DNA repair exonuclease SbcCD ATPase subunit